MAYTAYTWNGDTMWDAATIPSAVGRYLKLAGSTQLLVLLWMATIGRGRGDAEACAADLGGRVSAEDCEDALRFWEQEGLVVKAKGSPTAAKAPAETKTDATDAAARSAAKKGATAAPASKEIPTKAAAGPSLATAPPKAVKKPAATASVPISQRPRDAEFRFLLESVEMRLGKPLSHADQNRLLDMYDVSNLPVEVILMAVAYAVKMEKPRLSYIQAVVRAWEEGGIRTVDAADKHLCHLERMEQAWVQLEQWLELTDVRPTSTQKALAEKWLCEWSVSRELLRLAYERCAEKTGKFQASYMDRMLESWRQDGLDTPEKVNAPKTRRSPAAAKPAQAGGLNLDQYAAMVQTHTPKYRKKG